jgi:PAS domain-containing protein
LRRDHCVTLVTPLITAIAQAVCIVAGSMVPIAVGPLRLAGTSMEKALIVAAVGVTPLFAWSTARAFSGRRTKLAVLNAILHISRDWIWALDANRLFTYCSPAVRELLGYEAPELLGRPATQIMDPGDRADVQRTQAKQGHGKDGDGLGSTAFDGV